MKKASSILRGIGQGLFALQILILGAGYALADREVLINNDGNPDNSTATVEADDTLTVIGGAKVKEGTSDIPTAAGRLLELQFISEVIGAPVTTPTPGPTPTPTPTSTATPTPTTTATPYFAPYASIKAIDRSVIDSPLYDLSVVGKKLQFSTGSTLYGATQGAKEAMRINEDGTVIVNPLAKDMPMDGNNKSIGGVASSFHVNGNVSIAGNVAVSGTVQGVDLAALEKKVCELEKALAEARGQLYKAEYFGEAKRPGRRAERRSPGAQGLTHI